jgi:hypothetical protein
MAKEEVSYKYGIDDLEKETGRSAASLRIWLRKNGVKKAGKGYGWKDSPTMKAVAKKINEGGSGRKKAKKTVKKAAAKKRKSAASNEASAEA